LLVLGEKNKMKKPKKLDPALLQKGDLFRGKYWRYGMNHILKKHIKLVIVKRLLSHFAANGLILRSYMNRMKIPNSTFVSFVVSEERGIMELSREFVEKLENIFFNDEGEKC